jgi:hypothetical protein
LDSINLKNTLTGEVEEQVRVSNNSSGLVEKFFIYERGANNAWSLYDEYHLGADSYFSITNITTAAFEIFPNPCQGILNLNNPLSAELSIHNIKGQVVRELKDLAPNSQVNLNDLSSGLYLVQVRLSDNSFTSEKLIIE